MLHLAFGAALAAQVPEQGPPAPPSPAPAQIDLTRVRDPIPYPTLAWAIPQLIPSPEVLVGTAAARAGLRWQVTPLLYSFGINRRLTPFRFFVVDPLARQSGSVELFFSPEYVAPGPGRSAALIARTGVRSTFGLIQHGDYLAVSVGASQFFYDRRSGAALEAGVYSLFGILGLEITYSPSAVAKQDAAWIATLRIRYF